MMKDLTYFLLSGAFGKTPRRCRFIKKVVAPRHGECWVVDSYPPIAGIVQGGTVIVEIADRQQSLQDVGKTDVPVDIAISRKPLIGTVFDPRDFERFAIGNLVLPEQVSKRASI